MKKLFVSIIFLLTILIQPVNVFAQGMMGTQSATPSDDHTAREEAEGKEVWEKLQVKQIECKSLINDDYQALGEYFMGQSIGNTQRHELMNQMMTNMMGKEGEKQMHIAMGKRLSNCDTNAAYPQNGWGFMPMMWMMRGGGNSMMDPGFGMMNGWGGNAWSGFGILGWISMIAFWFLIILGVVALIRYISRSGQNRDSQTPLDILKKRYAHGEIDKKEFEEKKKDLA